MAKEKHEKSSSGHWKSTIAAGALEVLFFHPTDTIQKRLMKNSNAIYDFNSSFIGNVRNACRIALSDPKTGHFSVYPGLAWATSYKLLQRGYKFGLQPLLESTLKERVFSKNTDKAVIAGLSGAIMGAGEVVLLPLDIYKIRKQTGSVDKGFSYRAIHVTIGRNIIGSACLFGLPPFLAQKFYSKEEAPTRTQRMITDAAGAGLCLISSNPLDVVKTRMQADNSSAGALATIANIARNNPSHFFKALGPKLLTQGFKLTFFMTAKRVIEEKLLERSEDNDKSGTQYRK
jgi:hypothetical protein